MIHDLELTDKLSSFALEPYEGTVFRVTSLNADPTAAAIRGGRWAPPPIEDGSFQVLYTSMEKDGAIAEVASYFKELTPMPSKPLKVHELIVSSKKTITLSWADLDELLIDRSLYGERNYQATQKVGAALNFLGVEGLIAPSARWSCNNYTAFTDNLNIDDVPQVVNSEEFDWQEAAKSIKIL